MFDRKEWFCFKWKRFMKRFSVIFVVLALCLSLCACSVPTSAVTQEQNIIHGTSMFVEVEHATEWKVVYHRDTKVMYVVSWSGEGGAGVFTMLMNPDGTPQTWKGY